MLDALRRQPRPVCLRTRTQRNLWKVRTSSIFAHLLRPPLLVPPNQWFWHWQLFCGVSWVLSCIFSISSLVCDVFAHLESKLWILYAFSVFRVQPNNPCSNMLQAKLVPFHTNRWCLTLMYTFSTAPFLWMCLTNIFPKNAPLYTYIKRAGAREYSLF